MPNRIIREGWIDSPKVEVLTVDEERFLLRLMLKADDFGRYSADPILLKNTLFPLKENVRSTDSTRWLAACEKAGLVRLYETPKGRFLVINEFNQRTRAEASKYPSPDDGHPSVISPTLDGPPRARASSPTTTTKYEGESEGIAEIGGWFKRRPSTPWTDDERKKLRSLLPIPSEDMILMRVRYTSRDPETVKFRRQDLPTLLNNWSGEMDKARMSRSAPKLFVAAVDAPRPKGNAPDELYQQGASQLAEFRKQAK